MIVFEGGRFLSVSPKATFWERNCMNIPDVPLFIQVLCSLYTFFMPFCVHGAECGCAFRERTVAADPKILPDEMKKRSKWFSDFFPKTFRKLSEHFFLRRFPLLEKRQNTIQLLS